MSLLLSKDSTDVKTLGDFISLQRGTTYKSSLLGQPGAFLIGLGSIQREGGFRDDKLETYGGECPLKISLEPGDLYVSLKDITHDGHLLGAVARIPDSIERGRLTQDTVKLVFEKELFPRNYIYWLLRTPQYRNYCRSRQTGTTNLGLSREDFLSLRVPPLTEVTSAVVIVLESIEKKISNLRQQNETLESIAQTLFKHWFVDFEFPNEDGKPYKSSGGAMVRSDLGDIPLGWRVGKLGEIYKTTSGGTPSRKESEYYAETGIRWVKSKELYSTFVLDTEEKITPLGLKKSSTKLLPARTVLIAMYGATVGQVSILGIDSTCNQAICAVIEQQHSNYFIYLWLKHTVKEWTGMAIGSAQQNLSQILISKINILISSINLNNKFNAAISPLFRKILINSTQIQTLIQTRDRLLPKLMSGQLRIPES